MDGLGRVLPQPCQLCEAAAGGAGGRPADIQTSLTRLAGVLAVPGLADRAAADVLTAGALPSPSDETLTELGLSLRPRAGKPQAPSLLHCLHPPGVASDGRRLSSAAAAPQQ